MDSLSLKKFKTSKFNHYVAVYQLATTNFN